MNWTFHETRTLYEAAGEKPRLSKAVVRAIRRHGNEPMIVEKIARLQTFSNSITGTAQIYGQRDCSLILADWLVLNGYADTAGHLRGTYATEDECRAVVEAAGGLVPLVGDCAKRAGLSPALEPHLGAVAVVGSPHDLKKQWGAIWNGERWLVLWQDRGKNLLVPFMVQALSMWSI